MSLALPALAVTGSTGQVGGRVARLLAASGVSQRLLARAASRVPRVPAGVPVTFAGYADRTSSVEALRGVDTLFMVSAAEGADRLHEHRSFVDAAAEAGVRQVVYTSFLGASADSTFTLGRDHFRTEEHLKASGMEWTFLRDSFYLEFLPEMVGEDGVIRGPAGDGRVSAVSREDVAASAAAVLTVPAAHAARTYSLTGPEALSLESVAATMSIALGRDVRYHDETIQEAYESRTRWPAPSWMYDAWVSTYLAIANGEVAEVTDHVLELTGRDPLRLLDLLGR